VCTDDGCVCLSHWRSPIIKHGSLSGRNRLMIVESDKHAKAQAQCGSLAGGVVVWLLACMHDALFYHSKKIKSGVPHLNENAMENIRKKEGKSFFQRFIGDKRLFAI
jgi:hypothetical protein